MGLGVPAIVDLYDTSEMLIFFVNTIHRVYARAGLKVVK
jgi:hypothetical protein